MGTWQKSGLIVASLVVCAVAASGIAAHLKEERVLRVTPGMKKSEVEHLLGPGTPDVMAAACGGCPEQRTQFAYTANPSLWYGRFEDTLVVSYVEDVVCDTTRVGL